jgi:hypothetical protein
MNRGALLRPIVHLLRQKTSDEKRGTPKTQRGSRKRPLMKKEAPQKHKGAHAKELRRKKRHPKMQRGARKRPPMKKESPKKCKRAHAKDLQ